MLVYIEVNNEYTFRHYSNALTLREIAIEAVQSLGYKAYNIRKTTSRSVYGAGITQTNGHHKVTVRR